MLKIKTWFNENGFVGFVSIAVAIVAAIYGFWFLMWGSLGFFFGKNWEILIKLWNENKGDIEDAIEDVIKKK